MNLALAPDADEDTSATFIEGQAMGVGGGDQLILGDGEDDDVIQFGEGRAEVGLVGGGGEEEDEEEEDEDAEALLERLREHSQRSCSRLFAAADAMHDNPPAVKPSRMPGSRYGLNVGGVHVRWESGLVLTNCMISRKKT